MEEAILETVNDRIERQRFRIAEENRQAALAKQKADEAKDRADAAAQKRRQGFAKLDFQQSQIESEFAALTSAERVEAHSRLRKLGYKDHATELSRAYRIGQEILIERDAERERQARTSREYLEAEREAS